MPIPVAVGNTTNSEAAFALMAQGAAAVFVGVGPGDDDASTAHVRQPMAGPDAETSLDSRRPGR